MARGGYVVGLELDLGVAEKLALVQEDLLPIVRKREAKVRWTPAEQLQLVLKLIGPLSESVLAHAKDALTALAARTEPFVLVTKGVGVYPRGDCPRVIYARTAKGAEQVDALARGVEEVLGDVGIASARRPTVAQVALGRLLTPTRALDLSDVVAALAELPLGASELRELVLSEQRVTRTGVLLHVVARFPLREVEWAGLARNT